ncbi:hypothetical protein [Providencia sp.]
MTLQTYYSNEDVTTSTLIESTSSIGADKDIGMVSGFKTTELLSRTTNLSNHLFGRGM